MLVPTCISKEGRTVLGCLGELHFYFCLGLMWQKVAGSWPGNPHRWKALASPMQCMYVLDLCKVDYTNHSHTNSYLHQGIQLVSCGSHNPGASPVSFDCRAPREFPAVPQPGKPGFRPSSYDSLVLSPRTSGSSALNLCPHLCRGMMALPLQAGGRNNMRRCL